MYHAPDTSVKSRHLWYVLVNIIQVCNLNQNIRHNLISLIFICQSERFQYRYVRTQMFSGERRKIQLKRGNCNPRCPDRNVDKDKPTRGEYLLLNSYKREIAIYTWIWVKYMFDLSNNFD